MISINYNEKTKIELIALCKERNIKGYSLKKNNTKEKIIELLTGKIIYKDPREKENWSDNKKKSFETALKKED